MFRGVSTPVEDLRMLQAEPLHRRDYTRDGDWLICRACGARVELPMSLEHRRLAGCAIRQGKARAAQLNLVRVTGDDVRTLDRAGLVIWLLTEFDDEGNAIHEAWTRPWFIQLLADPDFQRRRDDVRRRELRRLSTLTESAARAAVVQGDLRCPHPSRCHSPEPGSSLTLCMLKDS